MLYQKKTKNSQGVLFQQAKIKSQLNPGTDTN